MPRVEVDPECAWHECGHAGHPDICWVHLAEALKHPPAALFLHASVVASRPLLRVGSMCRVGSERWVAQLPAWAGRGVPYSACITVPAGPCMELATPWGMF